MKHRLLRRQLARHFGSLDEVPAGLAPLLDVVDAAYVQADEDRRLLERSLELTSDELLERYDAIRLSEARMKGILDALPDRVFVISEAGTFLDYHAESDDKLLVPRDQIIGRHIGAVFESDFAKQLEESVQRAIRGVDVVRLEYDLEIEGAGTRWFEARLVGAQSTAVAIVRDVTESKQLNEQLVAADRLASVGTLAAGVGHEINNPLTYVVANLRVALEDLAKLRVDVDRRELELIHEALDEAQFGAERVCRIVRDLRTFARPGADDYTTVNLHDVLDSTAAMASNDIRHRARLVKQYGELPSMLANESRLAQVFLNLIVNAAQSLPVGYADQNEIRIRTEADPAGGVIVDITDTGPGIGPENASRIFEPFFTTKAVGIGTGLGLSICRGIVIGMGGEISVHETSPAGTTFRVVLPMPDPTSDIVLATPGPRHGASEARRRVLVIDDETCVGRTIARVLRHHEVRVETGGRSALAALYEQPWDVVFCDLMMPDVTGMDLYENVLQSRPDIAERFVFMSGGAFTGEARAFLASVSNRALEKPFDIHELRAVVTAS